MLQINHKVWCSCAKSMHGNLLESWLKHVWFVVGLRRASASFAGTTALAHGAVLIEKMGCCCVFNVLIEIWQKTKSQTG